MTLFIIQDVFKAVVHVDNYAMDYCDMITMCYGGVVYAFNNYVTYL